MTQRFSVAAITFDLAGPLLATVPDLAAAAQDMAAELGIPFLGEIPLNAQIRMHGDQGEPARCFTEGAPMRDALETVVKNLAGQISVKNLRQTAAPTITVE